MDKMYPEKIDEQNQSKVKSIVRRVLPEVDIQQRTELLGQLVEAMQLSS